MSFGTIEKIPPPCRRRYLLGYFDSDRSHWFVSCYGGNEPFVVAIWEPANDFVESGNGQEGVFVAMSINHG